MAALHAMENETQSKEGKNGVTGKGNISATYIYKGKQNKVESIHYLVTCV